MGVVGLINSKGGLTMGKSLLFSERRLILMGIAELGEKTVHSL